MSYAKDPRVDDYIDRLPAWQQAICQDVRDLVHGADPEVEETIKRTVQPYFVLAGNICALLATKDHVNVFLYDGGIVPDPEGIITAGHENKTARTVALYEGEAVNEAAPRSDVPADHRQQPRRRLAQAQSRPVTAVSRPSSSTSAGSTGARGDAASCAANRVGGLGLRARAVEPVARRQHRPEQQRLGQLRPAEQVGRDAELLGERRARARCAASSGGSGAWRRASRRVGRRDVAAPDRDDPARLQLEQREVRALGEELADDAEAGQVRVAACAGRGAGRRPEHGRTVVEQIRDVEVVARRADDRVDGLRRAVGERDVAALDRRDRRTADDAAVAHLRRGSPGTARSPATRMSPCSARARRSRRGCRPRAGCARAARRPNCSARQQAPLQRAELRVPLPVRRDAVDDLLDHVARLAERRDDRRVRGEVGRDLQTADAVAVDQHGAVAQRLGARVVERVHDLAAEGVDTGRHRAACGTGPTPRPRRRTARRRPSSRDARRLDRRAEAGCGR